LLIYLLVITLIYFYPMYWILLIIPIVLVVLLISRYRSKLSTAKKLDEINDRWGQPYVDHRNFNLVNRYMKISGDENRISPETAIDLDIDDIFSYIDRTNSKPGQQYLYKQLHSLSNNFRSFEEKIDQLCADPYRRAQIELKLSELNNTDAYYLPELFSRRHSSMFSPLLEGYIRISPFLVIGVILSLVFVHTQAILLLFLGLLIANAIIHYTNKRHIITYTHSLAQLLVLNNVSQWLSDNDVFSKSEAITQSLLRVSKLKKALGLFNVQNKINSDPTDISLLFTEWIKMLFMIEARTFIFSIKKVNEYLDDIKTLFEAVGENDMLISVRSVREGLPYYCIPDFNGPKGEMNIKGIYHPLIDDCVANSILSNNKKVVLVTGSNMSGKTTFIRAVALNALLAQTIHTCCASAYQAPALNIFTTIHMSDDLDAHKSYFQAEALSILNIINKSGVAEPVKSLVIIDEIFRGTNTIERIAAAMSVLSYLIENENFVFVSTHDLELAELLSDINTVYSFEERMVDHKLTFDYKIKEGVLKNKNGIAVLQRLGYPQSIIDAAYNASEQLWNKYGI
jgi:hypothetical protein